jgi:hypothetical protein
MSINKTAAESTWGASRPLPPGRSEAYDRQNNAGIGDEFRKGVMYSGLAGLGVGGLYYLSRYLADKYRQATAIPDPVAVANEPISEVTVPAEDEEESLLPEMPSLPFLTAGNAKAAALDPMFVMAPALGAGAGALIGAARAPKGRRRQNAILGATLGGVGGLGTAAATSRPLWHYVSENMPRTLTGPFRPGRSDYDSESSGHDAWRSVLNATLPAAGAAGGLALVDTAARQNENEKNLQKVEAARRSYFEALTGRKPPEEKKEEQDDQSEKKAALDAQLDVLYDAYKAAPETFEKQALVARTWENYFKNITPFAQKDRTVPQYFYDVLFEPADRAIKDTNSVFTNLMLTGGLGAGAIGAKYMYDQTKARSEARNLQKAREARRRMQGLDTPWIDPTELAEVKRLTNEAGPASARGV